MPQLGGAHLYSGVPVPITLALFTLVDMIDNLMSRELDYTLPALWVPLLPLVRFYTGKFPCIRCYHDYLYWLCFVGAPP